MPADFIPLSSYLSVFFPLFRAKLLQSIACTLGQFPHSSLAHSSLILSPSAPETFTVQVLGDHRMSSSPLPWALSSTWHQWSLLLLPTLSFLGLPECHSHLVLLLYLWQFINLLFRPMILSSVTNNKVHHSYILGPLLSLWSFPWSHLHSWLHFLLYFDDSQNFIFSLYILSRHSILVPFPSNFFLLSCKGKCVSIVSDL